MFVNLNYEAVKSNACDFAREAMNNPKRSLLVVKDVAQTIFKGIMLYNVYEAALSDLFCLKTLRHGTDPYAWLSIHLTGPDLKRGGNGGEARWYKVNGWVSPYAQRDVGRFYVVQDYVERSNKLETTWSYLHTKATLKYYSLRSTASFFGKMLPLPKSWKAEITNAVVTQIETGDSRSSIFGMLCPSVKLHLNPNSTWYPNQTDYPRESKHFFSPDEKSDYGEAFTGACYTSHDISVFDVGICGVLKNGLNRDLPNRIWKHKGQFLFGTVQLVVAVALTALFVPNLIPHTTALTAVMQTIVNKAASPVYTVSTVAAAALAGVAKVFFILQF